MSKGGSGQRQRDIVKRGEVGRGRNLSTPYVDDLVMEKDGREMSELKRGVSGGDGSCGGIYPVHILTALRPGRREDMAQY